MITAEELRIEELRLKYLDLIERPDVFPTRANWQFITSNAMTGLARKLYDKYLTALTIDDNDREHLHDIAIEEFPKFIAAVARPEAIDAIYSDISTDPVAAASLIRDNKLFDADKLRELVEDGDIGFAISLLDVYQPDYSAEDVGAMEALMECIDSLPQVGMIAQKSGLFGSSEKYICPDGHTNPADAEYCQHSGCGKNARGLTEAEEKNIAVFSHRLYALKSLLRK